MFQRARTEHSPNLWKESQELLYQIPISVVSGDQSFSKCPGAAPARLRGVMPPYMQSCHSRRLHQQAALLGFKMLGVSLVSVETHFW